MTTPAAIETEEGREAFTSSAIGQFLAGNSTSDTDSDTGSTVFGIDVEETVENARETGTSPTVLGINVRRTMENAKATSSTDSSSSGGTGGSMGVSGLLIAAVIAVSAVVLGGSG